MKRGLLLIVISSLLLALLLLFDAIPFLRGGFGWQWRYEPAPLLRVLPLLAALVLYGLGASWLLRREANKLLPAWAACGVLVLTLAALYVRSDDVLYELFIRTVSGLVTGPHMAGATVDWSNWLDWPQAVGFFEGRSVHVLQSGPGLPLWYAALNTLLDAHAGPPGIAQRPGLQDPQVLF
jgi:hypothetical protein